MKTILVVDDEQDIVDLLKYNLQKEGYKAITARNGKEAIDRTQQNPDLILLDIMMPERDGLDVLKELKSKERTSRIPVVCLTAKGSEADEIVGLELGADDYIIKPISIPKLIARIKTVLRKTEHSEAEQKSAPSARVGAIEISPSEHIVKVSGKEVFFPKKEFEVLYHLTSHQGQVVNRETLLNNIWGTDVLVVDRTVDVHIRKIREKLGKYADYIETIKGIGYRMREQ